MIVSGNVLSLIKFAVHSTVAQALGRITNFLIPFVILNNYKPSVFTDSFFFAMSIAFLFWGTISNSITDASIPTLSQKNTLLKQTQRTMLSIIVALISVLLLIAWGVVKKEMVLSAPLLLGVFVSTFSAIISSFVVAVLNVKNQYSLPGILWVLRVIPLLIFWVMKPDVSYLAWLMLGIGIFDLLRAIILHLKARLGSVLYVGWKEVFKGYAAVVLSSIVVGVNPIIDRLIAGTGQAGDLSLLELGERFYGIVGSLSTIGIMSVVLVELSGRVKLKNFSRYFHKLLLVFVAWSYVWLLLVFLLWSPFEDRIFSILKLTDLQYQVVVLIFFYYLSGLPAFIVSLVCVRGILSLGKSNVLTALAFISLCLNAVLSYILNLLLGVSGIALATSIVITVITVAMIILLSNGNNASR